MSELTKGKIPPSPYIVINDDYITEVAKNYLDFTPLKEYKVKRTRQNEAKTERRYMVVDNGGRYAFISPVNCKLIE